jgi:hypothetical protein
MMKVFYRSATLLAMCLVLLSHAFAQGVVVFANKVPSSGVDARVTLADGTPVSVGYIAQLYAGPAGTPESSLQPVLPTATFASGTAVGYIRPVDVHVPGVDIGQIATLQMRVFDGQTWSDSLCRGESNLILVQLGIQTQDGPYLVGLQPFQVVCIPEPSTFALLSGGLALLFLKKRMLS